MTADVSYAVLAGYAMLGRAQAIQALFLSWLFTGLSTGIAPESTVGSAARFAIIFSACISVLSRSNFLRPKRLKERSKQNRLVGATVLLGTFLFYHSLLFSRVPEISVLKAASFTITMSTLVAAWNGLSEASRNRVTAFVFGGLCTVLVVSIPLVFSPLGYLRNGSGFQGILSHPQAFGLTAALTAAWLGGRYFVGRQFPLWQWGMLAVCLILVVLSQARTAGAGLILGLGSSLAASIVISHRHVGQRWAHRRVHLLLFASMTVAVLAGPMLADGIENFLMKGGRGNVSSLTESMESSRGSLLFPMLDNIREQALTGIGFGIASDPLQMDVVRDPVFNLPVGAAIEKGIMPVAVFEELGIPLFVLVAVWLWTFLRNAAGGGLVALSLAATVLFLNFGENAFFSPGGMGLLMLILFAWSATEATSKRHSGRLHTITVYARARPQ